MRQEVTLEGQCKNILKGLANNNEKRNKTRRDI